MKDSFSKMVSALKKANDLKDQADDIKSKGDNLQKMAKADEKERAKLTREMLGVESYFDDCITAATAVRVNLTAISNDKAKFPEDTGTGELFLAGAKASDEHGKSSKQAKAAWATYAKALSVFADDLEKEIGHLDAIKEVLPKRIKAATELNKVCTNICGVLDKAMKVPWPSTVQAALFVASEDAGLLHAQASNILDLLSAIDKRVDSELKDGNDFLIQNMKWLAWATKAADMDIQAIRKNARAKTPR